MKTSLVKLGLVLALLVSASACSSQTANNSSSSSGSPSSDPVVTLTFGGTASAEDLLTQSMEMVATRANELSGGTIQISTYPASQLGDAVAQLESVIGGGQDMLIEAEGSYIQQYGITEAAVNSFGLVYSQELLTKELESDFWHGLEEQFYENTGVRTLSNGWVRQPTVIASKVPLRTVSDFKGIKLRTVSSKTTADVYNALGFSSTPVAYSEVYLSLSQGVIDATIATLDAQYTMGFYENAPYITNYGNSCTNCATWINGAKFDSMTQAQQEALIQACEEAAEWYTQESNALVSEYIEKMEANGAEFIDLSQEDIATCNSILEELAQTYEANGEWPVGTYDKLREIVQS